MTSALPKTCFFRKKKLELDLCWDKPESCQTYPQIGVTLLNLGIHLVSDSRS
ncbi:hypothetical protein Zm00014a_006761 [Zea mays]|uniref:Uncharacterized protein n=1 Tax=Zea mays TaxID=4577 RepID=A0A3L6FU63_MAIZE|nr:hypothetical protein Zm00014a_006761 [Zea mays]